VRLDGVKSHDFDTVFYPGGHGPMWDLAEDQRSIELIETPDGKPLVQGKKVTGFTDTEEEAMGLTKVVPFLVEDELKAKGGIFSKTEDWRVHVVTDGLLITGQNPASSGPGAKVLLETLTK